MYHFDTNAEQWIEIPTGFDRLSELTVSANGYLFAGTFGDGLYRSEEPMASIQQATALEPTGDGVPQAFALGQNYPNPFNPTTAITFELAAESSIALIIYNALGQEVRRLAEGRYRAGTYQLAWDGHDDAGQPAASGLYLYRLAADAFTQVRTMVLLR
ncbi:MAG: T9SS type A sorting domain-containing protein [Bacteroidetes bacterium]|nr:T9SS type A sorting domain-containing protein [Bacteroidota bacterium]